MCVCTMCVGGWVWVCVWGRERVREADTERQNGKQAKTDRQIDCKSEGEKD